MAQDDSNALPLERRREIQSEIIEHVQSLNRSGSAAQGVTREQALEALGFGSGQGLETAEQWLCGADGNCGVKSGT